MHITRDRVDVSVSPDSVTLEPGGHAEVTISLTNQGTVVDEFQLTVEGADPAWITLRTPSVRLLPGAHGLLAFAVDIPDHGDVVANTYPLRLRLGSSVVPQDPTLIDLPLQVAAVGGLDLVLRPQLVHSHGWAQYRLHMRNAGNAPHVVDLSLKDPEGELESRLALDRVPLDPQEARQVGVNVRRRERPLIGPPQSTSFTIAAVRAGQDVDAADQVLASATGSLVYDAPLAFLAPFPLWVRTLVAGLLALALALLAATWLLGSHGVQLPFTATPTPVPTVEPTLEPTTSVVAPPAGESTPPPQSSTPATTPAASAPAPPTISQYELSVPDDGQPGEFQLDWQVDRADTVTIAGQPEASTGTLTLTKPEGGQYELVATNAGGTTRKSIGVVIMHPPEIEKFDASPTQVPAGGTTTLSWVVKRGDRVELNGQPVAPDAGTLDVQPTATDNTYTLTVENELGPVQQTVTVGVGPSSQ
jgi:hypothetical protein